MAVGSPCRRRSIFFRKIFFARRRKSNAKLRNCVAMTGASSSRRLCRKPLELEGDPQIPPHFLFKLRAAFAARIWRFLRLKKTLKVSGRAEGIRTPDPLVPNQMRYQTALPPALCRPLRGVWHCRKKTNHLRALVKLFRLRKMRVLDCGLLPAAELRVKRRAFFSGKNICLPDRRRSIFFRKVYISLRPPIRLFALAQGLGASGKWRGRSRKKKTPAKCRRLPN